jgi:hypothetical protein
MRFLASQAPWNDVKKFLIWLVAYNRVVPVDNRVVPRKWLKLFRRGAFIKISVLFILPGKPYWVISLQQPDETQFLGANFHHGLQAEMSRMWVLLR